MYLFSKLYNCGIFQGEGKIKHYFEGWYFKHVDKERQNILSIIPGISIEKDKSASHAFIQIIDGSTYNTYYVTYKIEDFSFSKDSFEIRIADNVFSGKGIELNINETEISLKGKLNYSNQIKWPSGITSPNSMGWYAFIPIMECYHGVLSMHHSIWGHLSLNNRIISFDGGIGYMEKDWGTSFPSSWVWLQSNHFDIENTSLMLSIAKIPWSHKSFTGLITGVWCNSKFYRFTTYTGAKISDIYFTDNEVNVKIVDKNYELLIEATQGKSGSLKAPVKGAMTGKILESINGEATIKLHDKKIGSYILDTKAHICGMEIAGDTQELLNLP